MCTSIYILYSQQCAYIELNIIFFLFTQPIEHNRFKFRARRTGSLSNWINYQNIHSRCLLFSDPSTIYPRKSNASDAIAEHIAQYRWIRIASGKICMKSWMLPMCYTWHNFRFDIIHNCIPFFWLLWCLVRQQMAQIAGLNTGRHTSFFQRLHILANVLDHFISTTTKFIAIHFSAASSA